MDKKQKIIKGIVASDKMDKTIVVAVHTIKTYPKYEKKYRITKKYKVHNPENKYKIGDAVEFVQSRPISKGKRFKVL